MILEIYAKCADLFSARLVSGELENPTDACDTFTLADYDGYVPEWFPGEHYGDYVILEIEVETGKILNWRKPTPEQLKETFKLKG